MFFDFSDKSTTLFIFFVHGLIFSGLLLRDGLRNNNRSSYWLAFFLFLSSLYIAPFMFGYAGWYTRQPYVDILFYIPFQQLFLLPAALYFYVKSLFNKTHRLEKKDWLHFVPGIAYLAYALVIWITDNFVLGEYYFYADNRDKDLDLWYQVSGFLLMVYYLFRCLKLYTQYRKNTSQTVSYADAILMNWVQRFLLAFLMLLVIRLLFFILNPEWANFGSKFWYYLCFSILVYFISISGYAHTIKMQVPFSKDINFNQTLDALLRQEEEKSVSKVGSNISVVDASLYDEQLKSKIADLMQQERVFTDPDLTLFDVARKLESHPKKVSQTINKGFDLNFNDFVNSYRTAEVVKTIQSGSHHSKTLLGLAYDAGFNSKSTFNRAFKKQMGLTPKEFHMKNR